MRALCAVLLLVLAGFVPGRPSPFFTGIAAASQLESEAEAAQTEQTPPQPEPSQPVRESPITPLRVFAAIEKAWNEGQPDSIVQFFPQERILLRLEKSAPEKAFYSNKQAAYMLRDEFRFTVTESFEFVEFKHSKGGDEPPSARAHWTFRREPEGKETVLRVRIGLRADAGRWVVSEIRIQD